MVSLPCPSTLLLCFPMPCLFWLRSSYLCLVTPVEGRCRKIQTLQKEAAAAAVLLCQALGQGLQGFLGEKVLLTAQVASLGEDTVHRHLYMLLPIVMHPEGS